MIGRGSRTQGECEGVVFVFGQDTEHADLDVILDSEDQDLGNDGATILKHIFDRFPALDMDSKQRMVPHLDNNKWQSTIGYLKDANPELYNWIKQTPQSSYKDGV